MSGQGAANSTFGQRYGRVGLAFLHIGFNRGIRGTYGVFYVALLQAFGWSRAVTAGALSVSILLEGFSLPAVGSLIDRWGSRQTLLLGGLILATGLGFSSTISTIWQLYFWVGGVTALGLGLMGMVPHVAIISREFTKNRGLALGLAWAGGGFGIFLLIPLAQVLIEAWGWRLAYVGMAVLGILLVVLPSSIVMSRDEAAPTGKGTDKSAGSTEAEADWTVAQALTSSLFWLLFLSRVVASMGNQIITTHQVAHAVDIGYTPLFAASIFGIMGVFSIFGRVLFGYLTDRTGREIVYTLVQVVSAAGIIALVLARNTTLPQLLYIYAVCYGLGQGSRALVLSAISADVFLGKNFGAIYGFFTLSIGVGGATGAWLGGFLHDLSGNYTIPFMIAFVNFIVSIVMVWCVRFLKR